VDHGHDGYRRTKAGVDFDMGRFPVDGINPNGGSTALGHPFGVTGASVKELTAMPAGARSVVSVCADGGHWMFPLPSRERCRSPFPSASGFEPSR
jgi:Thiolase, C-terminal domain